MIADRQTHTETDTLITIHRAPYRGRVQQSSAVVALTTHTVFAIVVRNDNGCALRIEQTEKHHIAQILWDV